MTNVIKMLRNSLSVLAVAACAATPAIGAGAPAGIQDGNQEMLVAQAETEGLDLDGAEVWERIMEASRG